MPKLTLNLTDKQFTILQEIEQLMGFTAERIVLESFNTMLEGGPKLYPDLDMVEHMTPKQLGIAQLRLLDWYDQFPLEKLRATRQKRALTRDELKRLDALEEKERQLRIMHKRVNRVLEANQGNRLLD